MKHEEALKFCMESFLLTGSRYFNMYAPEIVPVTHITDYDFTAPASNPWLKQFEATPGVKRVDVNSSYETKDVAYWLMYDEPVSYWLMYDEPVMHRVFRLDELIEKKPQIQVIVRPSGEIYRVYREIFGKITPEFYRDYLWKSAPGKEKTKQIVGERMDLLMQYEMCER